MKRTTHRGGVLLPLVMVGIGVLFLLNNLGWLDWNIWGRILQLWPVLLIIAGIDILIGRGAVRRWAGTLVALAVVAGITLFILDFVAPVQHHSIAQPMTATDRARVELSCPACTLDVSSTSTTDGLITGTLRTGWNESVDTRLRMTEGSAFYSITGRKNVPFLPPWGQRLWNLALNSDVDIELSVDVDVGSLQLDLTHLTVSRLDVRSGVSKVMIRLPARGTTRGQITGGIGDLLLTVPATQSVRLDIESGVTQINVPEEFVKNGNSYLSPGRTSEAAVHLVIKGGIGRVTLNRASSI